MKIGSLILSVLSSSALFGQGLPPCSFPPYAPVATGNVYRFINKNSHNVHFFTADVNEATNLYCNNLYASNGVGTFGDSDWTYEGGDWSVNTVAGGSPVYRLSKGAPHLYTMSWNEVQNAKNAGWTFEGSIGYLLPPNSSGNNLVPVYRLYNSGNNDHFYTSNPNERNNALNNGYKSEGILGYMQY